MENKKTSLYQFQIEAYEALAGLKEETKKHFKEMKEFSKKVNEIKDRRKPYNRKDSRKVLYSCSTNHPVELSIDGDVIECVSANAFKTPDKKNFITSNNTRRVMRFGLIDYSKIPDHEVNSIYDSSGKEWLDLFKESRRNRIVAGVHVADNKFLNRLDYWNDQGYVFSIEFSENNDMVTVRFPNLHPMGKEVVYTRVFSVDYESVD